ncbi:hypothetical protein COW53_01960 [bacterium CG17_big_fil_post_rev_8_21_14_2_50_64_8]|nr:MAG: hypothetical protein COW53_01960 [bacterium CG17_big_fil_post_rev_8_21_14_2_50_64_8]PJA74298.1 MAG: hypothetical protein CO151_10005 [bacterium CG_4_9_14_3_um_filter_65_15]
MTRDIQNLLDAYHVWLKDKTALRQIDEWVEITTPYLDRHNDYVQIYAKRGNGGFEPPRVLRSLRYVSPTGSAGLRCCS